MCAHDMHRKNTVMMTLEMKEKLGMVIPSKLVKMKNRSELRKT